MPNEHARNPRYKLTMVSVWYRGRHTAFMYLPVGEDGKVGLPDHNAFFAATGVYVPVGCTFSVGA